MNDIRPLKLNSFKWGLVQCACCAPAYMTAEDVTNIVNRDHPTGISSQWSIPEDKNWGDGTPNGIEVTCDGEQTRHWFLAC